MYESLHAPDFRGGIAGQEPSTLTGLMEALRNYSSAMSFIHLCHTPEITLSSPTHARGLWRFEDRNFWMQRDEDHWLHGFGIYDEEYVKLDGQWLFYRRQIERADVFASEGAEHPHITAAIESGTFSPTHVGPFKSVTVALIRVMFAEGRITSDGKSPGISDAGGTVDVSSAEPVADALVREVVVVLPCGRSPRP